jgi:fused signal recognition particle receptor
MSADVIHTTINSIGTVVSMLVAVFAIYRSSSKDRIDAAALAKLSADEIIKNLNARISQIEQSLSGHVNKDDLMQELSKLVRVIKKLDNSAPHSTLLVLDATTGQNAHSQVEVFSKMTEVTGLVVTKLDGTAKGGVIVALADKFKLPIHAIGVGEGVNDFKDFDAHDYAQLLMGMEDPLVH